MNPCFWCVMFQLKKIKKIKSFCLFLCFNDKQKVTAGFYSLNSHPLGSLSHQYCLFVPYCDESKQGPGPSAGWKQLEKKTPHVCSITLMPQHKSISVTIQHFNWKIVSACNSPSYGANEQSIQILLELLNGQQYTAVATQWENNGTFKGLCRCDKVQGSQSK